MQSLGIEFLSFGQMPLKGSWLLSVCMAWIWRCDIDKQWQDTKDCDDWKRRKDPSNCIMSWLYWAKRLPDLGAFLGAVDNLRSMMWMMLVMLLLSATKGDILGYKPVGCQHCKPNLHWTSSEITTVYWTVAIFEAVSRIVSTRFLLCLKAKQVELW